MSKFNRRMRLPQLAVAIATLAVTALGAGGQIAGASSTAIMSTYTTVVSTPAPPSSSFSGASGGGDGWGVALTSTQLFNVFHHDSTLQVNCHNQSDASQCWSGPKTITDLSANNFASSGMPGLWVDQATGYLYVFATRTSDQTAGVVCIDTNQPPSTVDPFCGFTPLSGIGEGSLGGTISMISDPVVVGSKWYAFNYFSGAPTGTEDKLMCFDLTTKAGCASQPYAVNYGAGTPSVSSFPVPGIAAIAKQIVIPMGTNTGNVLACFNTQTNSNCAGSWPVSIAFSYPSVNGSPFPLLNASGGIIGFCLATGTDQCFDQSGASTTTPSGMAAVITAETPWNGPGIVIAPRVYLAIGGTDHVACFDYATNASCTTFPKAFSNLGYLYTVNPDPQRPSCIWVNADDGTDQIQNFDAYTGGPCGTGATRVLTSAFIVPSEVCAPTSWQSLQVTDPARSGYASGDVQFQDVDGNPIPGASNIPLDATGSVDLTKVPGLTSNGLPQFLISFNSPSTTIANVDVKLTWIAVYSPTCLTGGITEKHEVPGVTTPHTGEPFAGSLPYAITLASLGGLMIAAGQYRRRRAR